MATTEKYDVITLDIMIPKMDGITVCRKRRDEKIMTPILMLTAKFRVKDKVTGLDSAADDYLTKPFAFEELLARLRALSRKNNTQALTRLQVGDLLQIHIAICFLSWYKPLISRGRQQR